MENVDDKLARLENGELVWNWHLQDCKPVPVMVLNDSYDKFLTCEISNMLINMRVVSVLFGDSIELVRRDDLFRNKEECKGLTLISQQHVYKVKNRNR